MDTTSDTLLGILLRSDSPPDAWLRFVRLYTPLLYRVAKRQGFQHADAEDLTQELLKKLMTELPKYHLRPGAKFRDWLSAVTSRLCTDYRRRKATRSLPVIDLPELVGGSLATEFEDVEEAEYQRFLVHHGLEAIRGEFNEQTWAAFHRLVRLGHPAAVVAGDLGMSPNAVYLARNRVLTRLRREIDGFVG